MPKRFLAQGDRFDNLSAIRKTFFGLPEFRERRGAVLLVIAESKVNFWQVRIERERAIEEILSCRPPRRAWIESFPMTLALRNRKICPSQDKIGIQFHCLLIQPNCSFQVTPLLEAP